MNRSDHPYRPISPLGRQLATASAYPQPARCMLTAALIATVLAGPLQAEDMAPVAPDVKSSGTIAALPEGAEDISTLLPLLLTTPERRQLIGEVEAALRKGDVESAERHLNNIVEIGTLAIILIDRLRDPRLLSSLQTAGIGSAAGEDTPPSDPSSATVVAGLRQALEQSEARSETFARELAALNEDYRRFQHLRQQDAGSSKARIAELQGTAQREQAQREAALRELAETRDTLTALQAERARVARTHESDVADLQDALAQERMRNDMVVRELAGLMDELRAMQGSHRTGAIPSIHQLERAGAPAPAWTASANGFAQTAVTVSATGAITSRSNEESRARTEMLKERSTSAAAPVVESSSGSPEDRILARADALFRTGDVSGARLLLEHSLAAGNARAAFLLAETFDPQVLSTLRAVGIRGDAEKAKDLYARALALGIRQADERLQALR